jgi:lipopolysaccharide export LptBFGC system permease protein LptF
MRIFDRYIAKQILVGTIYAVFILSLVLVMGNLFKQARPLLVDQAAPLSIVVRFVINVLPFSLMFTIPWGFLSAVLLVFGRMSTDNEVTSLRVAGLSLFRLALPVFFIGALLSLGCLWININVVPLARASLVDLVYEQVKRDPRSLLDPGIVQSKFKNQKVFVEARDGDTLKGFHLYQLSKDNKVAASRTDAYVHAGSVSLIVDEEKKQLRLKLVDTFIESKKKDGTSELVFAGEAEPWLIDFGDSRNKKVRSSAMTSAQIRRYIDDNPELKDSQKVSFRAEITKRFSFSMACFSFAFIAVPLGLKSRRKDTSGGLIISLLIGAAYFLFTMMADKFHTDIGATLALWAPNLFCVLLGLWLFRRARFF